MVRQGMGAGHAAFQRDAAASCGEQPGDAASPAHVAHGGPRGVLQVDQQAPPPSSACRVSILCYRTSHAFQTSAVTHAVEED